MAYSSVTYPGTGSQTDFTFSFAYLEDADIDLLVDDVSVPFTFISESALRATTAPAASTVVTIKRTTSLDSPGVNYADGSTLLEADLDRLALWALYQAQESADLRDEVLLVSTRSIRVPEAGGTAVLPAAADRANKILGFDGAGARVLTPVVSVLQDMGTTFNDDGFWAASDTFVSDGLWG